MSAATDRLAVVRGWAIKAEHDFVNATNTLRMRKNCPYDTVCFHAQQCVEKYVKALLVSRGIDTPYKHAIGALVKLLPVDVSLPLSSEEQALLSTYAVDVRYPEIEAQEPIGRDEATIALKLAKRVRTFARKDLVKSSRRRNPFA